MTHLRKRNSGAEQLTCHDRRAAIKVKVGFVCFFVFCLWRI
jgi:hypothetical protein